MSKLQLSNYFKINVFAAWPWCHCSQIFRAQTNSFLRCCTEFMSSMTSATTLWSYAGEWRWWRRTDTWWLKINWQLVADGCYGNSWSQSGDATYGGHFECGDIAATFRKRRTITSVGEIIHRYNWYKLTQWRHIDIRHCSIHRSSSGHNRLWAAGSDGLRSGLII